LTHDTSNQSINPSEVLSSLKLPATFSFPNDDERLRQHFSFLGSQYHASQKSAAASSPSQSFTVPIGNTKLTIQVYHQGEEPAPAPQPQSSAQYVASGSSQSQYAIAGQIPYGGGAEPRLQYCTPGSTEKGVCLNGVDSLEPTRSKRSVEVIGETFRVHVQSYLQVAKKTAENAWNTFLTQPEVQYLLNVAERVFEHVSIFPLLLLKPPKDLVQFSTINLSSLLWISLKFI
jgi:hypothetical protein